MPQAAHITRAPAPSHDIIRQIYSLKGVLGGRIPEKLSALRSVVGRYPAAERKLINKEITRLQRILDGLPHTPSS